LAQILKQATPLDPGNDSPIQVLNYMLQLRGATRAGEPVKGELSERNLMRWEQVEPLVYKDWHAEHSQVCDRNALEVLRILGIEELDIPEWLKELL
jgi:hypothetical protein